MKRLFILSVIILIPYVIVAATTTITWPRNYSVFQRNTTTTGGSATIVFAGQFFDGTSTSYRIEKLNSNGIGIGDWKSYGSLPSGSLTTLGSSVSKYFYFSLTVPTGCYRFYAKDGSGEENSIKFGVGEVFIIAGQSNAQGADGTMEIAGIPSLDCVVSSKTLYNTNDPEDYKYLKIPTFGVLNSSNKNIGPRGDRPWYYQSLGNSIAQMEPSIVVPVCFFNVAHGGSSIDNWYDSMQRTKFMFSSNYTNSMTLGTTVIHQNPYGSPPSDNRFPYVDLKNIISFCGNMFGVRSILWHQGESETQTLTSIHLGGTYGMGPIPVGYSINNYDTKLNTIIADTRTILPGLPWAVSKVTLQRDTRTSGAIIDNNIVNNSGNNLVVPGFTFVSVGGMITQEQTNVLSTSSVSWAAPNSDNLLFTTDPLTNTRSDGTHFNERGLIDIKDDVFGNISSIFSKSPVSPALPARTNLTYVSPANYIQSTSSYPYYYWYRGIVYNVFDQTTTNMGNNKSGTAGFFYTGYTKDLNGRVFAVMPIVNPFAISGARIASKEAEIESNIYPNPVVNEENNLKIDFKLAKPSPVNLQIITEQGAVIDEIVLDRLKEGAHHYEFSIDKLLNSHSPSQIIYRLKTNEHDETKKILIIK